MKEHLKKYFFFIAVGFVILLFLYRKSSQSIINFPFWINLILFLIAFCPVVIWGIKYVQKQEEKLNDNMTKFIYGIYGIVLSSLLFFLIKIPVNYYIIYTSGNNKAETIKCPVTYYSKTIKESSKYIVYRWNDKKYRLNIDQETRKQVRNLQGNPEVEITLTVQNGALNTKVIQNYRLGLKQ